MYTLISQEKEYINCSCNWSYLMEPKRKKKEVVRMIHII